MADGREWDLMVLLGGLLAFTLPLSLLVPNFSVWSVIPKVQVTRFHILARSLSWSELNAVIIALLLVFFCIYLEIKKRKLDGMVERAMIVSHAADRTVDVETENQAVTMRACLELLDASSDHYEHLALLRDELRRREIAAKQRPPTIESSQDICSINEPSPLAATDELQS